MTQLPDITPHVTVAVERADLALNQLYNEPRSVARDLAIGKLEHALALLLDVLGVPPMLDGDLSFDNMLRDTGQRGNDEGDQ